LFSWFVASQRDSETVNAAVVIPSSSSPETTTLSKKQQKKKAAQLRRQQLLQQQQQDSTLISTSELLQSTMPSSDNVKLSLSATVAGVSKFVYNTSHSISATVDIVCNGSAPAPQNRPPCTIVAVIDVSGSMYGSLHLVKDTLKFIVSQLNSKDVLGIVSFGSNTTVELGLTKMDSTGASLAKTKIAGLQVQGATNMFGGLVDGLTLIEKRSSQVPDNCSVLLMTDGQANIGVSSTDGILQGMGKKLLNMRSTD